MALNKAYRPYATPELQWDMVHALQKAYGPYAILELPWDMVHVVGKAHEPLEGNKPLLADHEPLRRLIMASSDVPGSVLQANRAQGRGAKATQ